MLGWSGHVLQDHDFCRLTEFPDSVEPFSGFDMQRIPELCVGGSRELFQCQDFSCEDTGSEKPSDLTEVIACEEQSLDWNPAFLELREDFHRMETEEQEVVGARIRTRQESWTWEGATRLFHRHGKGVGPSSQHLSHPLRCCPPLPLRHPLALMGAGRQVGGKKIKVS